VTERRTIGNFAEDTAALYLKKFGYLILERNWTCRWGELDIVALDGATLVFVEVRYRHDESKGGAAASFDRRKQMKISRSVKFYICSNRYKFPDVEEVYKSYRVDLIAMSMKANTKITL
jgi:putative endonuclease